MAPDKLKLLLRFQGLDKVSMDQSALFLRFPDDPSTSSVYRDWYYYTTSRETVIPTDPGPFERSWNQLKAECPGWNLDKDSLGATASEHEKTVEVEGEEGAGEERGPVVEYLAPAEFDKRFQML